MRLLQISDRPGEALAAQAPGPARLDLPSRCARLSRWCQERGLLPAAPDPVMAYHSQGLPGARDQLYALVTQALG